MNIKQPKIIFFIDGAVPSDFEKLEAFDLGIPVSYRNAQHVVKADEPCDGVAGVIPSAYSEYPTAEEALKAFKAEIEKVRASMLDVGGKAPESAPVAAQAKPDKAPAQPEPEDPVKAAAAAAAGQNASQQKAPGWKGN